MFLTQRGRAGCGRTHGIFVGTRPLKVIILTPCLTNDAPGVDAPMGVTLAPAALRMTLSLTAKKHNKLKRQQ